MLEPSGYREPFPRYRETVLALATLASLWTNVLVKSWLSAGLVMVLVLVAGYAVYRGHLLWCYNLSLQEIGEDRRFRRSAGFAVVLAGILIFVLATLPTEQAQHRSYSNPRQTRVSLTVCMLTR